MKKYIDKNRNKTVQYEVRDKMLSMKDLTQQMRNREMKKLMEKFMRPYKIKKIISENVVELKLLVSMKTLLVVNMNRIALYQEQVEKQKKISSPLIEFINKWRKEI